MLGLLCIATFCYIATLCIKSISCIATELKYKVIDSKHQLNDYIIFVSSLHAETLPYNSACILNKEYKFQSVTKGYCDLSMHVLL